MFCRKCGKKISDNSEFCSYCGSKTSPVRKSVSVVTEEYRIQNEQKHQKANNRLVKVLILTIVVALLGIGAIIFLNRDVFLREAKGKNNHVETETSLSEDMVNGAAETIAEDETVGQETEIIEFDEQILALNQIESDIYTIDVFAENYQPGERNIHYSWSRNLFYGLEDVDPGSGADGQINGYDISRKVLKNAVTGNKMEYEIYKNPSTGKVNKIVSIEYIGRELEITDYYYDDRGRVNFIFIREDVNYVPSYAIPTKDGERFYFNSDCMVKWRIVSGGVQTNYVIGPEEAAENKSGTEMMYSECTAQLQAAYDAVEIRMINAAYNTYNVVLQAEGLTEISGYVYDQNSQAMSDVVVTLCEAETVLYEENTNADGFYSIIVPSENRDYWLKFSYEGYVTANLYNIEVDQYVLSEFQETVYLVPETDVDYNIHIEMYDALNYAADGSGMERLSNAAVYIREGMNHREGNVVAQGTADADGTIQVALKPGMYTAEVVKAGYDNAYYNFAARYDQVQVRFNASPTLASGEVRIVLTWGATPDDLDSHLFTPYDSTLGDATYHIWYGNKSDAVGNNLDVDDTTSYGPETMTIPVLRNGLYKYYVADYTNCNGNNPASYDMSRSGATIHVYTANGLNATFHVPVNTSGVIWEVFEIRNGAIVPIQRYYSNIDDKTWWHNDK